MRWPMRVRSRFKRNTRSGVVLAMALLSLLVASLLGLALIERVLMHHRQVRVLGLQQQCFWLAEAGIQRALRRLADSPDYRTERWEIPAEAIGTAGPAVVTIEVTAAAGSPPARKIEVEARLSGDTVRRNACRREIVIPVQPESLAAGDDS